MAQKTQQIEDDESLHGITWSPPIFSILLGAAFIGWGLFCNFQQVNTSKDAFLAGFQSLAAIGKFTCTSHDLTACVGLAQQWTQAKLITLNPKLEQMAFVLAGSIQCFLLSQGVPISRTYHQMKIKAQGTPIYKAFSSVKETATHLSFWQWLGIIAFATDVIGDVRYSMLLTGDIFGTALWAIFLSASSTLLLLNGVQRVWGGFHELSVYRKAAA